MQQTYRARIPALAAGRTWTTSTGPVRVQWIEKRANMNKTERKIQKSTRKIRKRVFSVCNPGEALTGSSRKARFCENNQNFDSLFVQKRADMNKTECKIQKITRKIRKLVFSVCNPGEPLTGPFPKARFCENWCCNLDGVTHQSIQKNVFF